MVAELSPETASPVQLFVNAPDVIFLGLQAMLAAHQERVTLVRDAARCDVELSFGPARRPHPVRPPSVGRVEFAADDGPGSAYRAARRGVAHVVPLDVSVERLLTVVEQARQSPHPDDALVRTRAERLAAEMGLTPREGEILTRICRGLSNEQVAGELYLSVNSVKTYIRSLYRKIEVGSRSQAVGWGLARGF